jgi:hypothetical protein
VIALLALSLVALIGFLGLAIDLGMLAIAKTQAQNAADLAALTAARTLSGDASNTYNYAQATTNATNILTYNYILGQPVQPNNQLTVAYGSYDYNATTQTFNANFPATSGMPYTAATATVTTTRLPGAFSTIFGSQFLPNVSATATAVHRPRDVALVMDLSSSMRYGTMLGFDIVQNNRSTNNPDTVVPTFGHYSSASANLVGPGANRTSAYNSYTISPANTTAGNSSYSLTYVNGFYQNDAYASTLVRAFDSYTSSDGGNTWSPPTTGTPQLPAASYATTPGGSVPLFANSSTTTYATNVNDVVGSSTVNMLWELDGYSAYSGGQLDTSGTGGTPAVWHRSSYSAPGTQFNGYTQGPGYYGKTFFLWPPDPRAGGLSGTTLTAFLVALGVSSTDASTLTANWSTYNLFSLKGWLKSNGYNKAGPFVPGSSGKAPVYYAVCRLFNRAYPAGASNGAFAADWRVRFFGTNDNTVLFNASGVLNRPGTYTINYNAILSWLTTTPNPFPGQMRAGRIKYYGAIPGSITGTWPDYGGTDQRFWVEAIDHMLGFRQTSAGSYTDVSAMVGYGKDFTWGTLGVTSPPSAPQYMSYTDNPARPQLRYWFSPILMVDYLHNYNMYENTINYFVMQPGDSYEAPIYNARQAFAAAINTMEYNHPNDYFTVAFYSQPRNSSSSSHRFNCVACPLGTNYNYARAAMFFPFSTINADGSANNTEVTPYDPDPATNLVPSANFNDTPRARGATCFSMGLMLAYNQFAVTPPSDTTLRTFVSSSPITFPTGVAGGLGRRGAQKVVIFETDGLADCTATASLVSGGSYNYYQIRYDMNRPGASEYPTSVESYINDTTVLNQVYSLVDQLASDYGTTRNPFRLYAIGFGPVFEGVDATAAQTTLQTMQFHAGTQTSASTPLPSSQIITGSGSTMSANMVAAYTTILQNGVQIALIK